jgi:hypothetical protein
MSPCCVAVEMGNHEESNCLHSLEHPISHLHFTLPRRKELRAFQRSLLQVFVPRRVKSRAVALPMPVLAPVMTTVLPSNLALLRHFLWNISPACGGQNIIYPFIEVKIRLDSALLSQFSIATSVVSRRGVYIILSFVVQHPCLSLPTRVIFLVTYCSTCLDPRHRYVHFSLSQRNNMFRLTISRHQAHHVL